MKIRILGLVVGASALAVWGAGCEQPQIDCRVIHGSFAAKYTLVSGGPECSDLAGDPNRFEIGVQSYYAASSDRKTVDVTKSLLAIRTLDQALIEGECGDYGDESCVVKSVLDGRSDFSATEPNDKDVCTVTSTITSEIVTNDIPANEGDPMDPDDDYPGRTATNLKYEWKNVRILTTPGNPGNLLEAELVYTLNGCVATYNVIAVAPVIGCIGEDDMGNPIPDDELCDDQPDPKYGIGFGSGISPDLNAKCDKDLGVCVATATNLIEGGP